MSSISFALYIFLVFCFLFFSLFLGAALTHINTLLNVFLCNLEFTLLRKWEGGVWGYRLEIWTIAHFGISTI